MKGSIWSFRSPHNRLHSRWFVCGFVVHWYSGVPPRQMSHHAEQRQQSLTNSMVSSLVIAFLITGKLVRSILFKAVGERRVEWTLCVDDWVTKLAFFSLQNVLAMLDVFILCLDFLFSFFLL